MRAALVVRALVGLWFAARMAVERDSWLSTAEQLGWYLRADGALALVVAGAFLREANRQDAPREAMFALVLLIDGAGRAVSGVATYVWPGLLEFPVTLLAFFGVMALCTTAVGLAEGTLVGEEEVAVHGRWHRHPQFPAGPVGVAAVASLGFGIAAMAVVGNPDWMRRLLVGHITSVSGVMAGLAWSRRAQRAPVTAPAGRTLRQPPDPARVRPLPPRK
jgi:hypothetical protein